MSKVFKIPEPTGGHPYRVSYRYSSQNTEGGKPSEVRAEAFYAGSKKGLNGKVERRFRFDHQHLDDLEIISVNYWG